MRIYFSFVWRKFDDDQLPGECSKNMWKLSRLTWKLWAYYPVCLGEIDMRNGALYFFACPLFFFQCHEWGVLLAPCCMSTFLCFGVFLSIIYLFHCSMSVIVFLFFRF